MGHINAGSRPYLDTWTNNLPALLFTRKETVKQWSMSGLQCLCLKFLYELLIFKNQISNKNPDSSMPLNIRGPSNTGPIFAKKKKNEEQSNLFNMQKTKLH